MKLNHYILVNIVAHGLRFINPERPVTKKAQKNSRVNSCSSRKQKYSGPKAWAVSQQKIERRATSDLSIL